MNFSEKMKKLREEKGKTQSQASKEMNIAISSLRNYEGGRLPDTFQLKVIKDYYQVPYEYLLDDECENKSNHTLDIGKELKLSDNAIHEIKRANNYIDSLNLFIEKCNLESISKKLNNYITLKRIIDNDLTALVYICDLKKYILKCIKQHKEEDLIEYFEKCDLAIKNVISYTEKNTFFFNPSDSCYDLLFENYIDLKQVIFEEKNKSYTEKEEDFQIAFDGFLELYDDVFKNILIYKKYLKLELFEHLQKFYNDITNEGEELKKEIMLDMELNKKIQKEPNQYKKIIKDELYKKTFEGDDENYKKILGKYLQYVDI